jgi:hypothetical protein
MVSVNVAEEIACGKLAVATTVIASVRLLIRRHGVPSAARG